MKKCIATLCFLFIFMLASFAQLIPDGEYVIKCARNSNYVMTLKMGKTLSDNSIVIHKWNNSNLQIWTVKNVSDGSIIIRSIVNGDYAVYVNPKKVILGGKVNMVPYGGNKNERWTPERTSDGNFILKIQQDRKLCISVPFAKYSDDNALQLYSSDGGGNQQFIFQRKENARDFSNREGVITIVDKTSNSNSNSGSETNANPPISSVEIPKPSSSSGENGSKTGGMTSTGSNTNTPTTTKTNANQFIPDGVYFIKCAGDPNYVMTLKNSKATSGNEIVVHKKKNSNDQKWKVENQKDGSIIIRSMVNEKYVAHVKSNEVGEWTKITSNLYGGKKNERWIPEKTAKGTIILRLQQDKNLCLDVLNYEYVDDNSMHLYSFHGDHNQQFTFELVKDSNAGTGTSNTDTNSTKTGTGTTTNANQFIPDGVYFIKCAGDPNYVMTLKNSKATSGNEIVVHKKKNSNDQKWKVENQKDGSIIIRSMVNEKYVAHVKSDEVGEWTKITSNLYGGKKNECWIPEKTAKGTFHLRLQQDKNLCLDVLNYEYVDDNSMHLYSFHGDHNQQFIFELVK